MSVTNIDELMNKIKEVREAQKIFPIFSGRSK